MPVAVFDRDVHLEPLQQMPQVDMKYRITRESGQALEALGNEGLQLYQSYQNEQKKLATFQGQQVLQDFKAQQEMALQDQVRGYDGSGAAPSVGATSTAGMPGTPAPAGAAVGATAPSPTGSTLAQNYMDNYATAESAAQKQISPLVKDAFAPHFNAIRNSMMVAAHKAQIDAQDHYQLNSLNRNMDEAQKQIDADPSDSNVASINDRMFGNIEISTLPAQTKADLHDLWANRKSLATYNAEIVRDPVATREALGGYKPGVAVKPIADTPTVVHSETYSPDGKLISPASPAGSGKVMYDRPGPSGAEIPPPPAAAATATVTGSPRPTVIQDPRKLMILNSVRKEAGASGSNSDTAAATLYMEDQAMTGKPSATGMQGLFQLDQEHRTKFGETETVQGQIHAGVLSVKEREDNARKFLGREPLPWETYLFHYQGEGGAAALLKADPNESVYDALARGTSPGHASDVLAGNPDTQNKTVGAFLSGLQRRMNNALNVTGGNYDASMPVVAAKYDGLSYKDLLDHRTNADHAIAVQAKTVDDANTKLLDVQRDAGMKDVLDRYVAGKLTPEYVQSTYRDIFDAPAYQRALGLAAKDESGPKESDFGTLRQIRLMSIDPSTAPLVEEAAAQAVADHKLTKQDYIHWSNQATTTVANNAPPAPGLQGHALNLGLGIQEKIIRDYAAPMGMRLPGARLGADEAVSKLTDWYLDKASKGTPVTNEDLKQQTDLIKHSIDLDKQAAVDFNRGMTILKAKKVEDITPEMITKTKQGILATVGQKGVDPQKIIELTNGITEVEARMLRLRSGKQ